MRFLSCNTIPITFILGKIKTIIITITISNSNNNSFFTITNCYYVSLLVAVANLKQDLVKKVKTKKKKKMMVTIIIGAPTIAWIFSELIMTGLRKSGWIHLKSGTTRINFALWSRSWRSASIHILSMCTTLLSRSCSGIIFRSCRRSWFCSCWRMWGPGTCISWRRCRTIGTWSLMTLFCGRIFAVDTELIWTIWTITRAWFWMSLKRIISIRMGTRSSVQTNVNIQVRAFSFFIRLRFLTLFRTTENTGRDLFRFVKFWKHRWIWDWFRKKYT